MQLTNSLVTICCNNVLSVAGGDIYISVMTIVSSVRQLVETPLHAINEGASPILSYNYGARRPKHVRKSVAVMSVIVLIYTAVTWSMIILIPEVSDPDLQLRHRAAERCSDCIKTVFRCIYFYGSAVYRTDCI